MKSYNVKCKGCGIYLNDDINSLGYCKNFDPVKTKYCKRCFDIKNYNKCDTSEANIVAINKTLDSLDITNYDVFIILDVLDLTNSLIERYKDNKNVVYVINKMDLLPINHDVNLTKAHIIENIDALGYQYASLIFGSTKSNSSIKIIDEYLRNSPHKKAIFLGKSNSGKTSLIKKLCALNKVKENVVVSSYLNTTNDLNQIKINKFYSIIDTPGFINATSLLNEISLKDIKKLQCNCIKTPKTFQVYESRTFKIENLVTINVYPSNKGSVTFYMQDNLHIEPSKLKDAFKLNNLKQYVSYVNVKPCEVTTFALQPTKQNVVISGLGMIATKNIEKVEVYMQAGININLLKKQII